MRLMRSNRDATRSDVTLSDKRARHFTFHQKEENKRASHPISSIAAGLFQNEREIGTLEDKA